jgi:hypothetical protein
MGRALNVIGVPTGAATFSAALEGLTSLNELYLRQHPETPALAASGVRYEKPKSTKWRDIPQVLKSGWGDCESLSTWRAAELRVSGEDPMAQALVYQTGPTKFHSIVLRGDGSVEDPSIEHGMKAPPGLVDRYADWNAALSAAGPEPAAAADVLGWDDDVDFACCGIGEDIYDTDDLVFEVERTPKGFRGHVRIPIGGGRALYGATSTASSERQAEEKATAVVGIIGSFWDDVTALASPFPQASAALRIARNKHVQNLAKSAYGRAKGKGGGGGGTTPASDAQRFRTNYADEQARRAKDADAIAKAADVAPTDGPEEVAQQQQSHEQEHEQQIDLRDSPADQQEVNAEFLAAQQQIDVYGFGPTPDEDAIIGELNAELAAASRPCPVDGFSNSRPGRGGRARINKRTPQRTPAYHDLPANRPDGSGGGGGGWQPDGGGAPPGMPGSPMAGSGYGDRAGYYPADRGGGGMSPRQWAQLQQQQQQGQGYGGGGQSSGGGGDSGGGGGGGYYPPDQYASSAPAAVSPEAFFNPWGSGLDQDEKADLLAQSQGVPVEAGFGYGY